MTVNFDEIAEKVKSEINAAYVTQEGDPYRELRASFLNEALVVCIKCLKLYHDQLQQSNQPIP